MAPSSNISLLSIVHGRRSHLNNLLRGIAEQHCPPKEVVVVFMNEAIPDQLTDPGCPFFPIQLNSDDHQLPLAATRNLAASRAQGDLLAFLDVDCIPDPDYLCHLQQAVDRTHGLVMGDVRYLPPDAASGHWSFADLDRKAQAHPRRPAIPDGKDLMTLPYPLFWSLAFGLRASDFARLGGFDEGYVGYGGEDTDFAFNARLTRLPLYACTARAYHQHHPVYSPPYNHLTDIVSNAQRFHAKWKIWPMEGWLKQFQHEGLIRWDLNQLEILKQPADHQIAAARSDALFV
ncbi:glycosyltransferase family 2 protein [Neolewinella litorea]|nr:glycosyltransferase [Neolewinella litorea]